MRLSLFLFLSFMAGTALADVARPVMQSSTTKALTDDLATGAKSFKISAAGNLVWEDGAGFTGAAYFRTAAGLAIGTNVQAYDDDLDVWAGITPTGDVQTLLGAADNAAMRTALGLGIGVDVQAYDAQLTTWAGITPDTGAATALANAVNASGGLLTYGVIGTSGSKLPLLNAANTWSANQRISAYLGIGMDATTTLCVRAPTNDATDGLIFQPNNATTTTYFGWAGLTTTSSFQIYGGSDLNLNFGGNYLRLGGSAGGYNMLFDAIHSSIVTPSLFFGLGFDYDAGPAHRLGVKSGALAVYNSFVTSTNWEAITASWSANIGIIGTDVGSGGGTARDVQFIRGGVVKATIDGNTNSNEQPVKLKSYIVSGLPSASTCGAGSMAFVTDATATTAYSTVAGGGSNKVLVISDGTNWIIH